jgi:hypothetical protein
VLHALGMFDAAGLTDEEKLDCGGDPQDDYGMGDVNFLFFLLCRNPDQE